MPGEFSHIDVVQANDILEKIKNSEPTIEYREKIIKGNLNVAELELSETKHIDRDVIDEEGLGLSEVVKVVVSSIIFSDCIFEDVVDCKNIYFSKKIEFIHVVFTKNADFRGAIFEKMVSFRDSLFNFTAEFGNACFGGIADFTNVRFQAKNIEFNGKVKFIKEAKFFNSIFFGVSNFNHCVFEDSAQFTGSRFLQESNFNNSFFNGHTDLRLVEFKGNSNFYNATFKDNAGFAESIFEKNADFRKVTFNGDYGNFRETKFSGEFISFRDAKFRNFCDQSVACKKARKQLEDSGSRNEADHNFFMEMEAKRRQKGITDIKNSKVKLILQKDLKLTSDFYSEFVREGLPTKRRLAIIYELIFYNLNGLKCLLSKIYSDSKNEELPWERRLSTILRFVRYNLLEYIIFRHIFGGYGIYWQSIILWWIFYAALFGFIYRYYFGGIGDASCLSQCIYFSFLVLFSRIFGNYQIPLSVISLENELVAFETLLGILMSSLFIASITRKYMR